MHSLLLFRIASLKVTMEIILAATCAVNPARILLVSSVRLLYCRLRFIRF